MAKNNYSRSLLRAVLRFALRAALACVQNIPYILVRFSRQITPVYNLEKYLIWAMSVIWSLTTTVRSSLSYYT